MNDRVSKRKVLVVFHTPSNAGYAMTALERTFYQVATILSGSERNVYFAFSNLNDGQPKSLPEDFTQFFALDYKDNGTFQSASHYIAEQGINCVLCFDIQPNAPVCKMLRDSGVKRIASYWGSTMSSKNVGIKLLLKKLSVWLIKERPDHFIFESEAMRELAVNGRGISKTDTSVIPTGVDIHRFKPSDSATTYAHEQFGFPDDAKIVFYSGHMEERKGVRVIVEGAIKIFQQDPASNIKFLICGNKPGEEAPFLALLENTEASKHVVFGGYRNDLPNIMPSCSLGVVASTGWDSFPMSTLEMAASGLPIVVSRLQGLVETLEDGVTGYTFTPGDASDFAEKVKCLLSDEALRKKQSESAVKRIKNAYTKEHQIENLVACLGACFK